jgi:hypothetical protein
MNDIKKDEYLLTTWQFGSEWYGGRVGGDFIVPMSFGIRRTNAPCASAGVETRHEQYSLKKGFDTPPW